MTYFRYDGNKRGFDTSGIRWEIYNVSVMDFMERNNLGVEEGADDTYQAIVCHQGIAGVWANLNQFDTARFIDDVIFSESKPEKASHLSGIDRIEAFLGIPKTEQSNNLWYMDGDRLKHRNAPVDKHSALSYVLYLYTETENHILLAARIIEEQPVVTDTQLDMLYSTSSNSADCIKILHTILDEGKS